MAHLSSRFLAQKYNHVQDTPSDTWTIVHGFGGYPIVDVFINIDGAVQKVIPLGIIYIDSATCTVTFTSPQSGYASVS